MVVGETGRRRRDARRTGLAAGHEPIPRRRAGGRRRGPGGCLRPRRADHGVLRLALEDRGPRPRHRPAAGSGGGRLLPLAVPQCHAARRGGGRRPPRDQPRPRHQRRRPRTARRGVGALGGAGRAGLRDRRRPPRRAVAGAGDHAARRARTARGGSRRRAGAARAARRRPIAVGAVAERRGPRAARRTARPAGMARYRARVGAGRGGPCSDVPDRRESRGGDRAAVPAACAGAARVAGRGAAQRRRLGAARGRDGCGRSPPPAWARQSGSPLRSSTA